MSFIDQAGEFWGNIKTDVYKAGEMVLEYKRAKNQSPQTAVQETASVALLPTTTEPNPEAQTITPTQMYKAAVESERVKIAGAEVDKNLLMFGGALLATAVILKVLS